LGDADLAPMVGREDIQFWATTVWTPDLGDSLIKIDTVQN